MATTGSSASYFEDDELAVPLTLPPSLVDLVDTGVWDSFVGFRYRLTVWETPPSNVQGWWLELNRPPFRTFAASAKRFVWDPLSDPAQSLLDATGMRRRQYQEQCHTEHQHELALDLIEPDLAVEIATFDSYAYASIILDYRFDPPHVLQLQNFGSGTTPTWTPLADDFDAFATFVGLNVNGPMYWIATPHDPRHGEPKESGSVLLDHRHPLGAQLTITKPSTPGFELTCTIHDQVIYQGPMAREGTRDTTGSMKRALVHIALAESPDSLVTDFVQKFGR